MNLICKVSLAIIICVILFLADFAEGEIILGVKEGDWIEYTVSTTGVPPQEFAVTWAKMEILSVQDTTIRSNVTTKTTEGNLTKRVMTFNLEKGQVGAWFIIPAGLKTGECFWDASLSRNVTIEGEGQLTFAHSIRTVTNATTPQRIKYWDKATGIFVECIDVFDNYSINATAIETNMWNPQQREIQQNRPDASLLVASIMIVFVFALTVLKQRKQ